MDKEVGLLVCHYLDVYLLCALVGSVTSRADVVVVLRAQSETHQLALEAPCFPQNEGQGLVDLALPEWGGAKFLVQWLG